MARDAALLKACSDPTAPFVLRFYAWEPATISLGYFQEYAEYEQLPPPAGDLPVVRRTTGGGAILHDLEITYSIVIPLAHPLVENQPKRLYELAHRAIIKAVGCGTRMLGSDNTACDTSPQRGPFFCFARRHGLDVVVNDPQGPDGISKLAGSAQRRTQTAILQHGSIMLANRFPQQPIATWTGLAPQLDLAHATKRLLPAFEQSLGVSFELSEWREDELKAADSFETQYTGQAWTVDRKK